MSRAPGRNLSPQEKARAMRIAVSALARGETNTRAAELAEVNIRTLSEWRRREPEFQQLLDRETERLAEQEPEAVLLLRRALHDPAVSMTQVNAARILLAQVPSEGAPAHPTEITFYLDEAAVERVLGDRRARYREESEAFRHQQQAQAGRVERLYQRDEKPLRAVPDVRQDEA